MSHVLLPTSTEPVLLGLHDSLPAWRENKLLRQSVVFSTLVLSYGQPPGVQAWSKIGQEEGTPTFGNFNYWCCTCMHVLCHVMSSILCSFTMLTCLVFPMVNQAPEVAAKPIAAKALYTWLLCRAIREVTPVSLLTTLGGRLHWSQYSWIQSDIWSQGPLNSICFDSTWKNFRGASSTGKLWALLLLVLRSDSFSPLMRPRSFWKNNPNSRAFLWSFEHLTNSTILLQG